MSRGKVITITLPEETWRELKRAATLYGKSISAFVRDQIERELGKKRDPYEEIHHEIRKMARRAAGELKAWSREELYGV